MEKSKKRAPSVTALEADKRNMNNDILSHSITQKPTDVKNELTATIPFHDLEDFVFNLRKYIKHAECLLQEVAYDYFNQTKEVIAENNFQHLWCDYNAYSTKADMVADTLFTLRKMAEAANAYIYPEEETA